MNLLTVLAGVLWLAGVAALMCVSAYWFARAAIPKCPGCSSPLCPDCSPETAP